MESGAACRWSASAPGRACRSRLARAPMPPEPPWQRKPPQRQSERHLSVTNSSLDRIDAPESPFLRGFGRGDGVRRGYRLWRGWHTSACMGLARLAFLNLTRKPAMAAVQLVGLVTAIA